MDLAYMRLFVRAVAADLEGRNLRLFFNQATACCITGIARSRYGVRP